MMLTLIIASLLDLFPSGTVRGVHGLIGLRRDRVHLPDRTAGRAVRAIEGRELERPPAVVSATGVELRGMVREGEQVSAQKIIEAGPCGLEVEFGGLKLLLRDENLG